MGAEIGPLPISSMLFIPRCSFACLAIDALCILFDPPPDYQPHGRQARQRAARAEQHGPDPKRPHLGTHPTLLLQVQEVQHALHRTDQGGRLQVGFVMQPLCLKFTMEIRYKPDIN